MKITLCTSGSRGDVQPFLALAVGLQKAGHAVTLVTPPASTDWIRSYGVTAVPTRFDPQNFSKRPDVQAIIKSGNVFRMLGLMRDISADMVKVMDDFWQATDGADFVVAGGAGLGGVEVASQRGVPLALAFLFPFAPATRAFPSFLLPFRFSLGGTYNWLTHRLFLLAAWPAFGGPLNQWRKARFGLHPWRSFSEMYKASRASGTPWLYGYSPKVLSKPEDWAEYQHITGNWFLDPPVDWRPPIDLLRFLEEWPPPVYVGFGSMRDEDPERLTRLTLQALKQTGQRGVLVTGWGGVTRLAPSANVLYVDDVPHEWLFPQMAVVVHHGGAGTTAAALRAGVPSIVIPFTADQFAWAGLVTQLAVGPKVSSMKNLTAAKLAEAIATTVNDSAMRAQAATLGEKIRAENGVARAVEIIERHAVEFKRKSLV